jgi:ribokinase
VRAAVIGHVEWVDFVKVESVPKPGEIVHASESWAEAAGGGAVAAVQLANLGCDTAFITALGDDDLGHRAHEDLASRGVRLHVAWTRQPQRRGVTYVDEAGERTITVIGEKQRPRGDDESLPWEELQRCDCVYFTAGDVEALLKARHARVVVATARELPTLLEAQVPLDALVLSARDPAETYEPGQLDPPPGLIVSTLGREGGTYVAGERSGSFPAADVPGPIANMYGAGDSFAAGLAFALARGDETENALAFAAKCGAAAMTGRGAYEGQLRLTPDR